MGLKKNKKLRTIFIEYMLSLGALIIILCLANYFFFVSASMVYPANYTEKVIQENYSKLKDTAKVTNDLITPMSSFGVYSIHGDYLYGNFHAKHRDIYWDTYNRGEKSTGLSNFLTSIEREDDILIINYPLTMQFKSEKLRSLLPNAEWAVLLLFFLQLIILFILWSNKFAKKVNRELKTLLTTMEKIKEKNLDFNVGNSNIEEIGKVLKGIEKLKDSLKIALEEQWLLEKQQKEQVSALAHDLKTPLTIVKGNSELLKETELTKEQTKYCSYIEESSAQMNEYIKKLLTFTKSGIDKDSPNKMINVIKILSSVQRQSEALSTTKRINIVWKVSGEELVCIKGDEQEVERAILNVIKNAFDFSPKHSTITIDGIADHDTLTIKVKDEGKGFSNKMLKYGKEQFVMDNESRGTTGHHGLGLYIANTIITKYNGELTLSNDKHGGGAVTVNIPLQNYL